MRSESALIRLLDLRHATRHRARLLLAVVGVATGVSLAVAVGGLTSSITGSLEGVAQAAASDASVEIRGISNVGLDDSAVRTVRDTAGVEAVGSAVESYTELRVPGRSIRTLLLGVDQGLYELSPKAFNPEDLEKVADPFGLFIPKAVADTLGVKAGEQVEVATPNGWQRARIGAIFRGDGVGGRITVAPIGVAQTLVGEPGRVDVIYVKGDAAALIGSLSDRLGTGARVGPMALRSSEVLEILDTTLATLNIAALVALFVGGFLVFNTMSMAAIERSREAALLRALGATRRRVVNRFVAEGTIVGVIGAGAGAVTGVVLARVLLATSGKALEEIFPVDVSTLHLSALSFLLAVVGGVVVSAGAAWLPGRRVADADAAQGLGPAGAFVDPDRAPSRRTGLVGGAMALLGMAVAAADATLGAGTMGNIAIGALVVALAGIAISIPVAVPLVASRVLPWVSRTPLTRLASGELMRSPGRTSFTVGAALLALTLVVAVGIDIFSFEKGFNAGTEKILRGDLYVQSATWRPLGSDVPVTAGLGEQLKRMDGVKAVYAFRTTLATLDGHAVLVNAIDFDEFMKIPGRTSKLRAEIAPVARSLESADTILATPTAQARFGVEVGDSIDLPTPSGIRTLRISGIFPDPSSAVATFILPFDRFVSFFRTSGADSFGVGVKPGVSVADVGARIQDRFGNAFGIRVDTNAEFRARINSYVTGVLGLIGSVQTVAVVVAAMGLANTLLISTLERRRDLGVLRAIGMERRQVRFMVAAEALMIAMLGGLGACVFGTGLGALLLEVAEAEGGVELPFHAPIGIYLSALGLAVISAVVAAVLPAIRASRIDVVDALHYE